VNADIRAADVRLDELARPTFRMRTQVGEVEVKLSLHGAHNVSNALAAAAVALELGLDIESLATALGRITTVSRWRMQVLERADGLLVINDAYNANPESMSAALSALATIGSGGNVAGGSGGRRRTHAVLGPMAELGSETATAHRELGAAAAVIDVHQLVVVGAAATGIAEGAIDAGLDPARVTVVDDVADAVSLLEKDLGSSDVVLVKASRSADLQRVAEALLASPAGATR
jgi:UDP-N-acetylmuramoyl-tripeptide--D-alanyl-D-alanine ligase